MHLAIPCRLFYIVSDSHFTPQFRSWEHPAVQNARALFPVVANKATDTSTASIQPGSARFMLTVFDSPGSNKF